MEHNTLENVNESSYLLVFRPKGSPLANTVSLVKDDANDLVREAFHLEKLRKAEFALLQEYFRVGNDNAVFASFDILLNVGYSLSYP